MKVEETHREPFREACNVITFPERKCKGDAFNGGKETSDKKSQSNSQN